MATFRIGDRVRVIAPGTLNGRTAAIYNIQAPTGWFLRLCGEAPWRWNDNAIQLGIHPKEVAYLLDVDGIGRHFNFLFGVIGCPDYWLRPLEDPKADAFVERMKKLGTEPISSVPNKEIA